MDSQSKAKPIRRFRLQTLSDPAFIKPVREYICRLAELQGFSKTGVFDIRVVVGEAIANIITHAYEGRPDGPIFIQILMHSGYLEIRFRDFGTQKPGRKIVSKDLSEYRESGLGVFLIGKLTDYHYFDQNFQTGTELVVKKRVI